ncbi:MAG: acyl-CoA reductase [Flavobacteriales bacterium]
MDLKQRIAAFVQLGKFLSDFAEAKEWQGYEHGVSKSDFEAFTALIHQVHHHNGWFSEEKVRKALGDWSGLLTQKNLEKWTSAYPELNNTGGNKCVALIMAGNIPLVGFHDLLSVLISGNSALVKLSSDDDLLIPFLTDYLIQHIDPRFSGKVKYSKGKLENFDAVIATGSDNSSRYFEHYFSSWPHIIRKNRTSVAVLSGLETEEQLKALGHDIFDYYGLGCRSISKVFIPRDFDLDRLFGAIYSFKDVIHHKKYANNFDYHKALYLMNRDQLLENGFLLVKEDEGLHSPLGTLFVERYTSYDEVENKLSGLEEKIQCRVGTGGIPFGDAQRPALWVYADGVDTMKFLIGLQ